MPGATAGERPEALVPDSNNPRLYQTRGTPLLSFRFEGSCRLVITESKAAKGGDSNGGSAWRPEELPEPWFYARVCAVANLPILP